MIIHILRGLVVLVYVFQYAWVTDAWVMRSLNRISKTRNFCGNDDLKLSPKLQLRKRVILSRMIEKTSRTNVVNVMDSPAGQPQTNLTSPLTPEEQALISLKKELNDQIQELEEVLRFEQDQLYDLRMNAAAQGKAGYHVIQSQVHDYLVSSVNMR